MSHPAEILKEHNLAPLKKFGQNFLLSQHSLSSFTDVLRSDAVSLEIGPGLGMVTKYLLENGFSLHVCEIDRSFASYLEKEFSQLLSVTQGDFLKTENEHWREKNISQVIGNLPFYITTPIIQKVVEMPFVESFLFGCQWEFAQRVCSRAGNSLTIFLNTLGTTRLLTKIKRNSFYPVPAVDGAWFFWQRNKNFIYARELEKLLRAAFWGKRKSLYNSLSKNPFWQTDIQALGWKEILEKEKKSPRLDSLLLKRADELSLQDYRSLLDFFLTSQK